MSVLPVGFGSQGGGYTIENSLRLRSSASAYLSRTFGTPTNNQKWTYSCWFKRGSLTTYQGLFEAPSSGSTFGAIYLTNTDIINWYDANAGATVYILQTSQVFRDPSAWYHLVCVYDSTQATASNRQKMYVNGVQITAFAAATYVAQNTNGRINSAVAHKIGTLDAAPSYFDGYLTEVNFIDGQALDPSSFGEYNEDTGVWQPAKYTGSYGTNGFYLPFSDATNTTTLAADASGNGNDWTPNNISLTSGVTYDSMTDTPTPYADGGNYPTWNPNCKGSDVSLANGNLDASWVNVNGHSVYATMGFPTTGKWYCEMTGAYQVSFGLVPTSSFFVTTQVGYPNAGIGYRGTDGQKVINAAFSAYGAAYTTTDIVAVVYDADNLTLRFYKNNVDQGAITVAADSYTLAVGFQTTTPGIAKINFGQRPFAYTPPTGFLPLHTGNLPDSTIVDGSTQMGILTYTGTNGDRLIATGETGIDGEVNFTPDLVWNKSRNTSGYGALWDSVRGGTNALQTYSTTDELNSEGGDIDSFVEGGTNFGTGTINASWGNTSGSTYVSWQWKANGAGVSNTDGSITSTVSANPTAGFSIVTYTGTGANATVGHGLGVAPKMVIVKNRITSVAGAWPVYHQAIGATNYLFLELPDQQSSVAAPFNDTAPTSTVFSVDGSDRVNKSGDGIVAYCFAEVEGYSKIGKWQNNNSTDGTFVYLGFRPRFILLKNHDNAESWYIWDSVRQTYNVPPPSNNWLSPNLSNSEAANSATTVAIDGLSNGFKIRTTNPATGEISFGTRNYIYMAFAENPFKNSLAR